MSAQEVLADMLSSIPYLKLHGIDVTIEKDSTRAALPIRCEMTNYVGIAHAGALYTLGETAAGVEAWRIVGEEAFILLRTAQIRYRRPGDGDVTVVATVSSEVANAARDTFAETSRAEAQIEVVASNPEGQTVFDASYNYAIRPRPQ